MTASPRQSPIAIVGLSALLPGSADTASAWRNIVSGRDLITDVPATHWLLDDYYDANPAAPDKTYAKRGGFLPDVEFDPIEFGVPPTIVPATDTAQLLALVVAQRALEDATGGDLTRLNRERIACLLGVTGTQELVGTMNARLQRPVWVKALREAGLPEQEVQSICDRIASNYVPWQESTFPGLLGNVVAGRIANRFDLRGTNAVTDAACASSLAAMSMGMNELHLGQADLVLTGGVDTMNDIFMHMCFSKTPALSASGDCRPFSDAADGTLLGEGLVMFALKRLEDAESAGDRIYAVIRGLGASSDGRAKSVYAPLPDGQARALRRAYESAGYGPETVELVEAHGTGTKAGDVAEIEGLASVFNPEGGRVQPWCALGSIKSQIGHTKAAAGAAGLFKAVLALHHKVLPPTIKVERPNPALCNESTPFYVNTIARPWVRDRRHPRRASVSSFGFGGSNFHVALEEYVPSSPGIRAPRTRANPTELIAVSGSSPQLLAAAARALATQSSTLGGAARESQLVFRSVDVARLAVVATSAVDLVAKLNAAADRIEGAPETPFQTPDGVSYGFGPNEGRIALLFPGQGSQYVGMGADVALAFDEAQAVWDRAAAVGVHEQVFPRPALSDEVKQEQTRALAATEWAQPAIGLTSLSLLRLLQLHGVTPDCVGGHSFGEVTALYAANALDDSAFLEVARKRGELMRDAAATPGAMSAVAATREDVTRLLEEWRLNVVIANHNAPRQVVISGATEAIADAERRFGEQGLIAQRLPVATAFHSHVVAASSEPFAAFLESVAVAAPRIDVWSNAEALPYRTDVSAIRRGLADQIARPVRFVDQIESMYAAGVRTFIEVGPSSVLTDLVGRILAGRPHAAVNLDRRGKHGVTSLQEGLARLCGRGVALDFSGAWRDPPAASEKPKKKPAMTIRLNGSNAGKPYPPPGGSKDLPAANPPRAAVMMNEKPASIGVSDAQPAWLAAFQDMQRQTAETHAAYQRASAEAHTAFLRATESSFAALGALMGGAPIQVPAPIPAPSMAPVVVQAASIAIPSLPAPKPAVAAPSKPVPSAPVAVRSDIGEVTLAIVAEKTGYPVSMLGLNMELEADLGIDSIKRVEILSALRERSPALGNLNPSDVAKLRTLGHIIEHARQQRGATAVAQTPVAAPALDVERSLLEVVADKTGYSISMLGMGMELEADLGIDSIKRVEILSALRERVPQLGALNPGDVAKLRTLEQIVEHMRGRGLAEKTTAPVPASPDLGAMLLDVVADKTGYPRTMIGLDMELEADLGIDSIKRVEILSVLRERVPQTATVSPTDLAKLRTLREIEAQLRSPGAPRAAPVEPPAGVPTAKISRFVLREVPSAASGLALPGLWSARRLAVVDDGNGVASALVRQLRAHGVTGSVVDHVLSDADGLIYLSGLRDIATADDGIALSRDAFHAAKAVSARLAAKGGLFITVQDTGGDFGLSGLRPWAAGLAALAKTAAVEWPQASVKAIDCECGARTSEEVAEAIVDELLNGAGLGEVGLHADGRRTTVQAVSDATAETSSPALDATSVVVVSGGARGVTAASMIALAEATKARIAILGRSTIEDEPEFARGISETKELKRAVVESMNSTGISPRPVEVESRVGAILAGREIRGTLRAIEAAGSKARYLSVDVTDRAAVSGALDKVRREWGGITAVVHGAGILADKLIAEKTEEQFNRVLDTKVRGLQALLDATSQDPVQTVCLFSSVAARVGNAGQCDYAMANEILNAVACSEHRRFPSRVIRSIGWGPWEGGMVTPSLSAHFKREGVGLIPLEVGARLFVDELSGVGEPVVVIGGGADSGALRSNRDRSVEGEIHVSVASHPELADHRLGAYPVVPLTLAVEWLLRGARALDGNLSYRELEDIRVLRGLKLTHFDGAGDRFTVRCLGHAEGGPIQAEIRGADGVVHYSATLDVSDPSELAPEIPTVELLHPWTRRSEVYDGHVLFHGPAFRVLQRVEGVTDDVAAALTAGVLERRWGEEPWSTDPAALDGVLQLALLWGEQVLHGATLPMSITNVRVHRAGPIRGTGRITLRAGTVGDAQATCDALLSDDDGVVAEFDNIGLVLRPGEPSRAMPAVA